MDTENKLELRREVKYRGFTQIYSKEDWNGKEYTNLKDAVKDTKRIAKFIVNTEKNIGKCCWYVNKEQDGMQVGDWSLRRGFVKLTDKEKLSKMKKGRLKK